MQILLKNNIIKIVVEEHDKLTQPQINQIKYFGFSKGLDKDFYSVSGDDGISITMRLISYFDRKNIPYTLSKNLSEIKKKVSENQDSFSKIKKEAADFKEGIFDESKFNDFCSFINNHIKRKLKDHQIKAAYHHYLLKNAANFSVPGSGKTTTIITVYEKLKSEGVVDTLFVVGPPSSFKAWKTEFKETLGKVAKVSTLSGRSKQDRIIEYYGADKDIDLFLITFQTFANDFKNIKKFFFQNKIFLVIDEAHYIKQIDGKWASSIIDASEHAKIKYILTGTPCPKNYADLFNLFDFLWGKNNAISEKEKSYINICEKNNDYQNAQTFIKDSLDPLFYRVRKDELGLKKPIFHDPIFVEMNDIERKVYDRIFERITKLSYYDRQKNFMTLLNLKRGRIMRLRQMTSYSKLLKTAIDDYDENLLDDMDDISNVIVNYDKYEHPAKLTKLIELINLIQKKDKKIVIWTNFIKTINLLEKYLRKNNFQCNHICGDTPIVEKNDDIFTREKIIDEFLTMNSSIDILIANPKACAESISLHKTCHHAIYYDLDYNCAQYLQSLDRIHRVGGSENKEANYYFLQYKDTIDSDILNNLILKRDKMYNVIEHNSDIYNLDISTFTDIKEEETAYDRIFKK
ncbi:MAG: DEAD/DEAH box helicase [Firmicutes bacterium]|nr:DEAD/DEAH box helicase [Bacillota bacterium]